MHEFIVILRTGSGPYSWECVTVNAEDRVDAIVRRLKMADIGSPARATEVFTIGKDKSSKPTMERHLVTQRYTVTDTEIMSLDIGGDDD